MNNGFWKIEIEEWKSVPLNFLQKPSIMEIIIQTCNPETALIVRFSIFEKSLYILKINLMDPKSF